MFVLPIVVVLMRMEYRRQESFLSALKYDREEVSVLLTTGDA